MSRLILCLSRLALKIEGEYGQEIPQSQTADKSVACADSESFFQRGSNFFPHIHVPLKSGHHRPPAKRHLNGVSLACR